jgi:hypothetical protein
MSLLQKVFPVFVSLQLGVARLARKHAVGNVVTPSSGSRYQMVQVSSPLSDRFATVGTRVPEELNTASAIDLLGLRIHDEAQTAAHQVLDL